jgi:hypothetical protein
MRRVALVGLLAALPVLGSNRGSFHAVARVIDAATVSARAGSKSIRVEMKTRAAALLQVGSAAPVRASSEQTVAVPSSGDLVITLLY